MFLGDLECLRGPELPHEDRLPDCPTWQSNCTESWFVVSVVMRDQDSAEWKTEGRMTQKQMDYISHGLGSPLAEQLSCKEC